MQFARWIEAVARGASQDLLNRAPARRASGRKAGCPISVERLEQRRLLSGTAPAVVSITRTGTPITNLSTVGFNVTFNQSVTGVAPSDFKVISDGTVAFTAPVAVSGSGSAYTVNVSGVRGNGDLQLELVDNDTIVNATSVPLGGTGIGNGSFVGQNYSILQTFPTVQSIARTNPAGTTAGDGSVTYTVTFNKPVTGVDATAFVVNSTGTVAVAGPILVSGSGAAYSVMINGITGVGNLWLNLVDNGTIHDLVGNPLQSSSGTAGSFQPPVSIGPGPQATAIAVADVNGDGIPDLIEATGNTIGVMLGNGNGTFQATQTVSTGVNTAYAIAVADMNGDGKPDLIVANERQYPSGSVGILLGNGNGSFGSEATFAARMFPSSVAVADLNGDGKLDVVATNTESNNISVLLGNGDGTLQAQQNPTVGASPRSVAIADLNGDGIPDLIVANGNSTGISVLLGNGDGSFQPQHTFSAGAGPYYVTTADLNGDGNLDVIVANTIYHAISVLLGNGDGSFKAPIRINTNSFPDSIAVSDLNGDGIPDLIVANPSSIGAGGALGVLLGNGNGTFLPEQYSAAGSYPTMSAVGDFNGDGKPDVVFNGGPSNLTTTATLLLGNGIGNFTGQTYVISAVADTINGTTGNDNITLTQDPSVPNIDWTMGSASGTLPINDPNGLTINGNGGNDTINLVYTNGNPLPNIMHLNSGIGIFTINNLQGTAPLAGTTVDIERSTLFINYGAGPDPLSLITGYLKNGYNGGTWTGTNAAGVITSANAAAAPKQNTAIGYADSADGNGVNNLANTIELTYTLYGDANLDRQVNSTDLQIVLFGLNKPGVWDQGDFNYDSQVNSSDLQIELFTLNTQLGNQAAPATSAAMQAPAPPTSAIATTVQSPISQTPTTSTTTEETTKSTTTGHTVKTLVHLSKPPKPHPKTRHHRR